MVALHLLLLLQQCLALRYDPAQVGYNLNENQNAIEPKDYSGKWENHTYNPSPENWRMPFYVLTIDRFVDGDPTNNDANNTVFEHHWMSNQFRFGGDVAGVMSDLDYVQGLGGKTLRSWKQIPRWIWRLSRFWQFKDAKLPRNRCLSLPCCDLLSTVLGLNCRLFRISMVRKLTLS